MTSEQLQPHRHKPLGVTARTLLRELGFQDWLVLAYFVILCGLSFAAAPGPNRDRCLFGLSTLCVFFGITLAAVRLRAIRGPFWAAFAYRMGVYGSVQASYFLLRDLLPLVNPTRNFDPELYRL